MQTSRSLFPPLHPALPHLPPFRLSVCDLYKIPRPVQLLLLLLSSFLISHLFFLLSPSLSALPLSFISSFLSPLPALQFFLFAFCCCSLCLARSFSFAAGLHCVCVFCQYALNHLTTCSTCATHMIFLPFIHSFSSLLFQFSFPIKWNIDC